MPKVEIINLGAKKDRKPLGKIGDVINVDERTAKALTSFGYAKIVEAVKAGKTVAEAKGDTAPVDGDAESAPAGDADTENPQTEDTPNPAAKADAEAAKDADAEAEPTAKEIRAWAKENGVDVPARGAIPDDVREKYDAAHAAK